MNSSRQLLIGFIARSFGDEQEEAATVLAFVVRHVQEDVASDLMVLEKTPNLLRKTLVLLAKSMHCTPSHLAI